MIKTLLFLFLPISICFADIESDYQKCLDKSQSSSQIDKCSNSAIESWNIEIKEYLNLINNKDVNGSQFKWEEYIKSYKYAAEGLTPQGTMYVNIYNGIIVDAYKHRALELKSIKELSQNSH